MMKNLVKDAQLKVAPKITWRFLPVWGFYGIFHCFTITHVGAHLHFVQPKSGSQQSFGNEERKNIFWCGEWFWAYQEFLSILLSAEKSVFYWSPNKKTLQKWNLHRCEGEWFWDYQGFLSILLLAKWSPFSTCSGSAPKKAWFSSHNDIQNGKHNFYPFPTTRKHDFYPFSHNDM